MRSYGTVYDGEIARHDFIGENFLSFLNNGIDNLITIIRGVEYSE
tara:strand:- start:267 stop:401 length:135 start_codon:yes stop_codon:yes gene_type:complete